MVMTTEERAERRLAGMQKMTFVRKIHRSLVNGRPPASEFKTPLAAVTAARSLFTDIERKLTAEGMKPEPGGVGVCIAYVPPDLSFIGHTVLYAPGRETAMLESLNGHIMLGLVFGIHDPDANDEDRFAVGARPFVSTKQVEDWLAEIIPIVALEVFDEMVDASR
jgi:hypothetical protein